MTLSFKVFRENYSGANRLLVGSQLSESDITFAYNVVKNKMNDKEFIYATNKLLESYKPYGKIIPISEWSNKLEECRSEFYNSMSEFQKRLYFFKNKYQEGYFSVLLGYMANNPSDSEVVDMQKKEPVLIDLVESYKEGENEKNLLKIYNNPLLAQKDDTKCLSYEVKPLKRI